MSARFRPMTRFLPRPPRPAPPGADLLRRAFALASLGVCAPAARTFSSRPGAWLPRAFIPHNHTAPAHGVLTHTGTPITGCGASRARGLCHGGLSRRAAPTAFYYDPPRARSLSHDRPNSSRTVLAPPSQLDTPIVTAAHRFALRLLAQDGKWARRKTTAIRLASLRRASPPPSHGATQPTRSWLT